MKRKPTRKNAPGAGRPPEGRVKVRLYMLLKAVKAIDARKTEELDTRGKVVEALVNSSEIPKG